MEKMRTILICSGFRKLLTGFVKANYFKFDYRRIIALHGFWSAQKTRETWPLHPNFIALLWAYEWSSLLLILDAAEGKTSSLPLLFIPFRFSVILGFRMQPHTTKYLINALDTNEKLIIGLRAGPDLALDYINKFGVFSTIKFKLGIPEDRSLRVILSVSQTRIGLSANCTTAHYQPTPNDFPPMMSLDGLFSIGNHSPVDSKVSLLSVPKYKSLSFLRWIRLIILSCFDLLSQGLYQSAHANIEDCLLLLSLGFLILPI